MSVVSSMGGYSYLVVKSLGSLSAGKQMKRQATSMEGQEGRMEREGERYVEVGGKGEGFGGIAKASRVGKITPDHVIVSDPIIPEVESAVLFCKRIIPLEAETARERGS